MYHNLRAIEQKGEPTGEKNNQNKNLKCERRKHFMLRLFFCHSFRQIVEEFASQMWIVMEWNVMAFTWCTFSDCNYCAFDPVVWIAFGFAFVWHLQNFLPPLHWKWNWAFYFSVLIIALLHFAFYGFKIPLHSSLVSFPFLVIKSTYIETN